MRLRRDEEDAKCRAINALGALANFGPVSHSRSQEEQDAICPLRLKEIPEKNQKPCSDSRRPQTALQAALERGCDIPGDQRTALPLPPGAGADGAGCALQEAVPQQKGMCRAMGWTPRGCGFCQCSI